MVHRILSSKQTQANAIEHWIYCLICISKTCHPFIYSFISQSISRDLFWAWHDARGWCKTGAQGFLSWLTVWWERQANEWQAVVSKGKETSTWNFVSIELDLDWGQGRYPQQTLSVARVLAALKDEWKVSGCWCGGGGGVIGGYFKETTSTR